MNDVAPSACKSHTLGYVSRLINKKDVIVNKVFVEMLEKLGYDIQITYVKKEK